MKWIRSLFFMSRDSRILSACAIAALLLWEIWGRLLRIQPTSLPTPSRILFEIWLEFPIFQGHAAITLQAVGIGLLTALALTLPLAYLIAQSDSASRILGPLLRVLLTAPSLFLIPIIIMRLVPAAHSRVAIALILALIPLISWTLMGFRSLATEMKDLLWVSGAGKIKTLTKLQMPACWSYLVSGLKAAYASALVGVAIGEMVGFDKGLGHLLLAGASRMDAIQVFAAITMLAVLGVGGFCAIILLTRILPRWNLEITHQPRIAKE